MSNGTSLLQFSRANPLGSEPGGVALVLETPRRATSELLGGLAQPFLRERELYCVDAANVFDPYAFSRRARVHGLSPEGVLDRVYVTRCFTIHQLQAVVDQMLPPLAGRADVPAVAVLGVDFLFLEESLRAAERGRVLATTMERLGRLRREGLKLLVTHDAPPAGERWWRPLLLFGDVRGRVHRTEQNELLIQIARCPGGKNHTDVQHVPAGRDRGVAALPPGTTGGA